MQTFIKETLVKILYLLFVLVNLVSKHLLYLIEEEIHFDNSFWCTLHSIDHVKGGTSLGANQLSYKKGYENFSNTS